MFAPTRAPMDERYVKLLQNNPQYQSAMDMMAQGSSSAPTSSALAGIARALQGVAGGVSAKHQMRQYYDKAQEQADWLQHNIPGAKKGFDQGLANVQNYMAGNNSPGGSAGVAQALMGYNSPTPGGGAPPANPMQPPAAGAFSIDRSRTQTTQYSGSSPVTNGSDYDTFKRAIIAQESGGRYGVMNAEGSGAMGIGQVMPATAAAIAKRLGMPYREDLMKGTSPEARQYQDAITEGAIRDAYNSSSNDRDRAHYYYGGSDRNQWGKRTRKYGNDILRRLGSMGGDPASASGAPETGVISPSGPAPQWEVPELPQEAEKPVRPADRAAANSGILDWGLKMLGSGNQALMGQGMDLVDRGLQEKFQAEREAIARQYGLDTAEYSAATEDYYGSKRANRDATIAERAATQSANRDAQYGQWQQGNRDRERTQDNQWQTQRDAREHGYRMEEIKEQANSNLRNAIAEANMKSDVNTAAKRDAFFYTPAGRKVYDEANAAMNNADDLDTKINRFEALNDEAGTGSVFDLIPGTREVRKWGRSQVREMDSITNDIAPRMRQAGSGAMSDKDVEMYVRSVPNTSNDTATNKSIISRMRRGNARVRDYQTAMLNATADGNLMQFTNRWRKYINAVSAFSGNQYISYNDWLTAPQLPTKRK